MYIYAICGCKCSSKQYRIHWRMNGRSNFCEIKKHCTLKKNFSLWLNAVTYKENYFFMNNYFGPHPFLMSFYFTKIFVLQSVIAGVCYFSVYKLIRWNPLNIYLFKVNNRNTRKRYEICPKSTTNTIESCSGVFTIKCFCCWFYISKFLSRSSFLSKYY